jgi:tetratricopeptide (TPR) repeat protein
LTTRHVRRLPPAAALLAAVIAACTSPQRGPAWDRWGISRATTNKDAPARLAAAYDLLYAQEFGRAESAYAALAADFPQSSEAHLGYAMALRYTGKSGPALDECRKALELDPDAVGALNCYADLTAPLRSQPDDKRSTEERFADAEAHYDRALQSSHPAAAHVRTGLWALYIGAGRLGKARSELEELGRAGYYPPPLADHARNLLITLEPDAVLFTNGDNDTYPLLVLQEYEGLRRDVRVVNLSLLNVTAFEKLARDSLGVPISLDDAALDALKPVQRADGSVELPADRLMADIIDSAAKRGVPVYFATTVYGERVQPWRDRLVLEGVVWRVAPARTADTVNAARIEENFAKYRLDSIGQQPDWPANLSPLTRSVRFLAVNYASACAAVARGYSAAGNNARTLEWCRRMADFCRRTGEARYVDMAREIWLELMPGNAEARDLRG